MGKKLIDAFRDVLPGAPKLDLRRDDDAVYITAKWADGSKFDLERRGEQVHYGTIKSHRPGLYQHVRDTQPGFWLARGVTHFTASIDRDTVDPKIMEMAPWEPSNEARPGNHIWWLKGNE